MSSHSINKPSTQERQVVGVLFLSQLLNVLEFMMIMPLGPDVAKELNFDSSQLGLVGSSYTFSAAFAGILGSFFLDRFPRRNILCFSILGLGLATLLATRADSFSSLIFARVLSGAMGGPLSSIVMAMVSDAVPPARRGKAIGIVMGAFAVASIVGIPFGLELALWGSWRTPFYALTLLALVLFVFVQMNLNILNTDEHQAPQKNRTEHNQLITGMYQNPAVRMSLLAIPTIFAGNFMIIPNIASYVQNNLHYPREHMSQLYLYGGLAALFTTQLGGRLCDRWGPVVINSVGTVLLIVPLVLGFMIEPALIPVSFIFISFMAASTLRNVSFFSQTSQIPSQQYRAQFMSMQSALNHFSVALGAYASASMLSEGPSRRLMGMHNVAIIALCIGLTTPWLLSRVQKKAQTTVG
ncbi:MAG: MFS transporter [Oligoflexales bacterium]|nr:MFS transporter [Oligoflexales bacterium]